VREDGEVLLAARVVLSAADGVPPLPDAQNYRVYGNIGFDKVEEFGPSIPNKNTSAILQRGVRTTKTCGSTACTRGPTSLQASTWASKSIRAARRSR